MQNLEENPFIKQWQPQIDSSLAAFAPLAGDEKDVDLVYIVATAVLWPIRAQIQSFDVDALEALRLITHANSKYIIKLVQSWQSDRKSAISTVSQEAQTNAALHSALIELNTTFDAVQLFANHLASLFVAQQSDADIYTITEQIKGTIITIGGQTNIESLEIKYNATLPPTTTGEKRILASVTILAIIVTLVVIVISWLFWMQQAPEPLQPMGTGFNVAVAEFLVLDSSATQEIGTQFSKWLFDAIEKEAALLPPALSVDTRGPDKIGVIQGQDPEIRKQHACETAVTHNATILIYGTIIENNNDLQVQLAFCVPHESFDYGSEITGPEDLGQPVSVDMSLNPDDRFNLNVELNARAQALRHIVAGLANMFIRRYPDAAEDFQHAVDVDEWQTGKEVAYLLLGAAHLRSYDQIINPAPLTEAEAAFQKAYELDPNYGRSYLGLGAVARIHAATLNKEQTAIGGADVEKLLEARKWFSDSLTLPDQPALAYIPEKAAFGLGQTYLLGFENQIPDFPGAEAEKNFEQVIAAYETNQEADLAVYAAHSYALRGRLAGHHLEWKKMAADIQLAINLLNDLPNKSPLYLWIARYSAWLSTAEEQAGNMPEARAACKQALDIGSEHGVSAAELDMWRDTLMCPG